MHKDQPAFQKLIVTLCSIYLEYCYYDNCTTMVVIVTPGRAALLYICWSIHILAPISG